MSEAIAYPGLCSTCRHAVSCTCQSDPKRPVLSCEEFEIETGEPLMVSGKDVLSASLTDAPAPAGAAAEDDLARYKGLCGNCHERRSCTFPKPEGGIWHCEEYR